METDQANKNRSIQNRHHVFFYGKKWVKLVSSFGVESIMWLVLLLPNFGFGQDNHTNQVDHWQSPTDTLVVYDTVFEFSPQRFFPKAFVFTAVYMPQNMEIRYGTWKAQNGFETYEMNTSRLDINQRIAMNAKSYARYQFFRANLDLGIGVHYFYMDYYQNYFDYYRDEYISNERHVYESGGIIHQKGEFITVGPQVNAHAELGNFKKVNSRLTLEANVGLYAYTSVVSKESFNYSIYDKHWIWYDNGVRALVSWKETHPLFQENSHFSKSDINYHVDVRMKFRMIHQCYAVLGLGYNGLTFNPFSNSNTTVGIQYLFGTKYGKRFG